MSNKPSTKPLSGFMELLPEEQKLFNELLETIKNTYELCGFIPMDQPLLDRKEVLLAKAGGETEKQIYELTKGDTELALRFDLTVPLARYVANNYGSLTFPFRRYAIGKVYRGERAQAGRFREFYQCDVDIIGNETLSIGYDAEMPIMIARVFDNLNAKFKTGPYKIRINNRKLLSGLFEALSIEDKATELLALFDKKEKISSDEFTESLQNIGLDNSAFELIQQFLDSDIDGLPSLSIENEQFQEGISETLFVLNAAQASGSPIESFVYDPTIVRGLDYYTGVVFETQLVDYPQFGSVCSGGRYDNLAGQYTNRALPGVGMSIGLSRLFDQLVKNNALQIQTQKTNSQVLIVPIEENNAAALTIQKQLLDMSIACEINWSDTKLDKRIGYGDKMGIPYLMVIGNNEVESGEYVLKNMQSGESTQGSVEDIVTTISKV